MEPVTLGLILAGISAGAAVLTTVLVLNGVVGRLIARFRGESTPEERALELQEKNLELQEKYLDLLKQSLDRKSAGSELAANVQTDELAKAGGPDTPRLLAEAVALQDQGKEREAIERLLTAYDEEMPPEAKAQLHLLVGNGYYRLSDYGAAEHHYVYSLEAARVAESKEAEAAVLGNLGVIYSIKATNPKLSTTTKTPQPSIAKLVIS